MQVQSYLFFDGRCEEAVAFYQQALGAKLEFMMRYKESPDPLPPEMVPPGNENKIMHASLQIGETLVMVCDDCSPGKRPFQGFSLSLAVKTSAEADQLYAALADQGTVIMPLTKTFWSPRFGMLTDRFGVGWMVNVVDA